ncbi:MAG: hypothetical protein ABW186_05915 [Rhodanobacteraceae bacterium]
MLALVDALRDKRSSNGRTRIPVTRRLHSGSSNTSDWDRHRPGHFVAIRM